MTYTDEDRAAYRDFVERLVDDAVRATRANGENLSAASISEHVAWDSTLLDEMIQTRIVEVTS